jgi:hypothetical protein
MKWKKLKGWLKRKVKKLKKDDIETPLSGSDSTELYADEELTEEERSNMVDEIMSRIMDVPFFQETFEKLADKPITMLLPFEGRDSFYLYNPTLQSFKMIKAPVEAVVVEESNGRERLCLIHNKTYMVPDKYLKNVGYN